MTYTELFPSLVDKKHIQTRHHPPVSEKLPYWYKAGQFCAYHQGAPGHNLEDCYGLKSDIQRLIKSGILYIRDVNPNLQVNSLPQHGGASINMVEGCPGTFRDYDVCYLEGDLVKIHLKLGELIYMTPHNYAACGLCRSTLHGCRINTQGLLDAGTITVVHPINLENNVNVIIPQFNIPEPLEITFDSHNYAKSPLVIYLSGPAPYQTDKVVPYKYQATMIKDGKEVPLPFMPSVVNITDVSGVTRSRRVFTTVSPRNVEASVGKKMQVEASTVSNKPGVMEESSRASTNSEFGEVLSIVANATACNNLSFSHEELPIEGKDHNMALHISMNCLTDYLSGVLVDTGSSLNVMPKSTLSRLTFQGAPMRSSGFIVKAFEGSKKIVIGEVDLPMNIGPHTFQITF
ncbi:uncharacterized protein LOC127094243 [Lathyrus oleraceus]|uniref:uncharacterized protein LOC127094243 n=1 Tax=Pisum sativum TaxID=3888 RepID=UPI0021CF6D35|nr:uncharacterized protein LOC127094243 [Pisum sativum]